MTCKLITNEIFKYYSISFEVLFLSKLILSLEENPEKKKIISWLILFFFVFIKPFYKFFSFSNSSHIFYYSIILLYACV